MHRDPPSIREVARLSGVSITTVSHALSGKRPVNAATAGRVRDAVAELGYVPATTARNLRTNRTDVIGLILPDIANTFFSRLAQGVEDAANEAGFSLILCDTDFDAAREDRYLDLLRSRFIDGLVYIAGSQPGTHRLGALVSGFPVVLADEDVATVPGAGRVSADHRQGGRLAGLHLRHLGHRDALVVAGPAGLRSSDERILGFREHFPAAILTAGDFTESGGHRAVTDALATGVRFSAVFAVNDLMAIGAMAALRDAGVSIPTQVSIVGYDDIPLVDRLSPALTTIRQPAYEIGRLAARQLLDRLLDDAPLGEAILPVELIVRASTAVPTGNRE